MVTRSRKRNRTQFVNTHSETAVESSKAANEKPEAAEKPEVAERPDVAKKPSKRMKTNELSTKKQEHEMKTPTKASRSPSKSTSAQKLATLD